ncbi:MAG: hypothetical protein Fur005_01330 [Roseiflexaceae bacterium]
MLSERMPQYKPTVSANHTSHIDAAHRATLGWFASGMVILSAWYLGGLYLDGWAHSHGRVDTTFFTPWHAVFYSGFLVVALLVGGMVARGVLAGAHWQETLPRGYGLALIGIPLFAFSGVADLIWHELFGIEESVEALLSPSHLLLAISMAMILISPARSAWQSSLRGRIPLPAVLSLAFTLCLITFMTQFGHPFVYLLALTSRNDAENALGVSAIILQSALLIGFLLAMWRRWEVPFGVLTCIVALNVMLMSVIEDRYRLIPFVIAGALLADLITTILRMRFRDVWVLRLCATLPPILIYAGYMVALAQMARLAWSIHLWMGSLVAAGLAGLAISILAAPATIGHPEHQQGHYQRATVQE